MIHPLKVPTSLQESPGCSLSGCLDRVLGKMNPSCDMSYFLLRFSVFFTLLLKKTQKRTAAVASHKNDMLSAETAILFLRNWSSVNLPSRTLTKLKRF